MTFFLLGNRSVDPSSNKATISETPAFLASEMILFPSMIHVSGDYVP
jgi:hypothetical protein